MCPGISNPCKQAQRLALAEKQIIIRILLLVVVSSNHGRGRCLGLVVVEAEVVMEYAIEEVGVAAISSSLPVFSARVLAVAPQNPEIP